MKREIITTADGSTTIHLPDWNEQYHSKHGAIQEAYHVFIKHGLTYLLSDAFTKKTGATTPIVIRILEIGFGTGLNAFITAHQAEMQGLNINYVGVEGYPVAASEVNALNYPVALNLVEKTKVFHKLHDIPWEEETKINAHFALKKEQKMFDAICDEHCCNLIYFDAFGARVQPELWTEEIFKKMYKALQLNGVLVTYAAKGSVRRAMQAVGFNVEKLPGPPGKREMLRATKLV